MVGSPNAGNMTVAGEFIRFNRSWCLARRPGLAHAFKSPGVVGLLRNDVKLAMDFYAALKPTLDGGKGRAIATSRPPALTGAS